MKTNPLFIFAFLCATAAASAQTIDPSLFSGLKWRSIGPFRGGRVAAVGGAVGDPAVFYMGLPEGGVWKTNDAGMTWNPVFDSVKDIASVGAVTVAPSDSNVVYAGTGDMPTSSIDEGNGVYKSTDAGKTWEHLGLDDSKQIPCILVDPHDPNIVLVAAQGDLHKKSDTRGVFRSTDGGKTWSKTLFVDNTTGIEKLACAYDEPNVILATTDRHYSEPGAGRFGGFGGGRNATGPTGTALYKSTDEGATWTEVKGTGLPRMAGRTCVAIAMHTNAQRMFVVGTFGLYRSDNGGDNWARMDEADPRVANGQGGYNCGVYVNSANPDIIYVINTSSYVSTDGGKTFTGFKGAPGGDDPQQMWVDPMNGNRLIFGSDQGATISLNGGETWSSWYNQATGQCYHISTDNRFPYWVYGTQQDSGCIATSTRGNLGEITPLDWLPHPGYEFGFIVPDPLNPMISYAGGPANGIVKVTYPSGQWIDVSPDKGPDSGLRPGRNQPLAFNAGNPHEFLLGFQYLMSTTDGGLHWRKISPDLGFPKGYVPPKPTPENTATPAGGATTAKPSAAKPAAKPAAQTPQNPTTENEAVLYEQSETDPDADQDQPVEQRGPNLGGSVAMIAGSPLDGDMIWVGTTNGMMKLTKDHGRTWDDVNIKDMPTPAQAVISSIDPSHLDKDTAYVAVEYHNSGNYEPFLYRTHDAGKTWTKIVNGLPTDQPSGSFTRVIRADTVRPGLLFAGTESSVYVSFNDGDNWQPLTLNLPNTSVRDLVVHGNDLVAGTFGRSFWVLDDITPLRELSASIASEPAHFYKPADAIRIRRNVNGDTPFPPEIPHALNAPDGVIVDYYLSSVPTSPITLEISDPSGNVLRHYSSAPIEPLKELPPEPNFWLFQPRPMPTAVGENRINWNLRCDDPPAFSHTWEINANPGQTPASPEGPLVPPGAYTLTLTVDGKAYIQHVNVKNDPRSPSRDSDVAAQYALQMQLYKSILAANESYKQVAALRAEVDKVMDGNPDSDCGDAAQAFDAKILTVEGQTRRGFGGFGGRRGGGAPPLATFVGVQGDLTRQLESLDTGDMHPNDAMMKACSAACKQLDDCRARWEAMKTKDLASFNAVLSKNKLAPITMQ